MSHRSFAAARRLAGLFLAAHVVAAFARMPARAEDAFRVGDKVEILCTCFGPMEWVEATIESISGPNVVARYGQGKYQTKPVSAPDTLRKPGSAERAAAANEKRLAFLGEAGPYRRSVEQLARFHDPRFPDVGLPVKAAEWDALVADLGEVDRLCRTRYPDLMDDPSPTYRSDFNFQVASWCAVAARRAELVGPAKEQAAKALVRLTVVEDDLELAFRDPKNIVTEEIQALLFEREAWRARHTVALTERFAELGTTLPADFFTAIERRADELRALIDRVAPERTWTPPPFSDPAVEAFVKRQYASDPGMKGVKVLRIGLDYKSWVERESLTYVGSDSTYRYYKVDYERYKRGWALVEVPGRPYCQAQEWIVGRDKRGAIVLVSMGGAGVFMRCP